MKKVTRFSFLLILSALFVVSCKPSLSVSSDYDRSANFSKYKTFSLYYLVTSRNVNELNEERIWNSIRAEMIRKGYVEDNKNYDLLVNAVSILKDKRYLTASSSGGWYRPYGYWGAARSGTIQANDYKEGSLVIDVVDAKTQKLIWQGTGSAEFEKKPKDPDAAISGAVTKILSAFPKGDTKKELAAK